MNNIKYIKYLAKHKYYVTRECFKRGLYWRGLVHDLSKILPKEWPAYRNYFYGDYREFASFSSGLKCQFDCWSISKEGVSEAFDYAWLNHQHKNKHHWQYWVLRNDDGTTVPLEMPKQYATEMFCDWIGAGLAITGKKEFYLWYDKNKHKMLLHDATRKYIEDLIILEMQKMGIEAMTI